MTDSANASFSGITELRVHGVGGATPEELLGVPHAELVAGTDEAGFFRPAAWLPGITAADHLEAYSWGGITSRSRSRALWVFLLPFAMLNIAGWMFSAHDPGWRRPASVILVRLAALLNTAIFTTMFAVLLIDVVSYECATTADCDRTWFLAPWRWWTDSPSEAVGVGVIALAGVVLAVAALARLSRSHAPRHQSCTSTTDPARQVNLASPELWRRGDVAHWLGTTHLSFGLAIVSLFGVEAASRQRVSLAGEVPGIFGSATFRDSLTGASQVATVVSLVVVVLSIALVASFGRVSTRILPVVLGLSVIGLVLAVVDLFTINESASTDPLTNDAADLVLVQTVASMIFGAFILLFGLFWLWYLARVAYRLFRPKRTGVTKARVGLTALAFTGASGDATDGWVRRLRRATTRMWINDNDPVMSLQAVVPVFGAGVVVAIGSSVILQMQRLLGTDYPEDRLKQVAALGFGWVFVLILVGLAGWFSAPGRRPNQIARDYEGQTDVGRSEDNQVDRVDPDDPVDGAWLKKISDAESAAQITDRAETLMTVPAVIVLVLFIALEVLGLGSTVLAAAGPAVWALSVLPIALVGAMNRLYRDRNFRRALGIVWDVATFWPRWFHPWAPPSYGERAVDQLRRRLEVLTDADGGVVLSAHSQGTVVAAAALAQLAPDVRGRVALVTHGSPLTRVYGRYFQEFFSQDAMAEIADGLVMARIDDGVGPSWRNLYRRTDYIGGPIVARTSDERRLASQIRPWIDDTALRDPHDPTPLMKGDPRPVNRNHSNYYADPVYAATVADFAKRLNPKELPLRPTSPALE